MSDPGKCKKCALPTSMCTCENTPKKKGPYKVEFSETFKEKISKLNDKDKAIIMKGVAKVAKNPMAVSGSMSVFGDPSPEEMRQWMGRVKPNTIDEVMEYLHDKGLLNEKGEKFAKDFWKKYIHKP